MDEVIEKAENKKFDLILFSHCLENLRPISSLNKVHMLLKDDGFLFIDTSLISLDVRGRSIIYYND